MVLCNAINDMVFLEHAFMKQRKGNFELLLKLGNNCFGIMNNHINNVIQVKS